MTYIIVGASAGLGRALTEKFASEKNDLIIISSDMRDLIPIKNDLEIRFKITVMPVEISFKEIHEDFSQIDYILTKMSPLEGILFPIGYSDTDDTPELNNRTMIEIFNTNFISVCMFLKHFLNLLRMKKTTIIGFGSIAAIRGRTKNANYAASKRALESFFESMIHYMQDSEVVVQFYILGYLDTNLGFEGQDRIFFRRADVQKLSDIIYSNRLKNLGITLYPKKWKLIKIALPFVPWVIFKRVKF